MRTTAVILAGGASRRMGTAKALLDIEGETFVDRLIGVFQPLCASVVVVLGHHAERIRAGMRRDAVIALNPDPSRGQLTSLQCGLRTVGNVDAVFFTPVDCPAIATSTVKTLMSAMRPEHQFVIPRFNGRRGHPVLFRRELTREFLELDEGCAARDIVHRYISETCYVDVPDPGILQDIDEPVDYANLIGAVSS